MDKKERKERIDSLNEEIRTVILYEAPHRLKKTLKQLHEQLGERQITITRELTKRYEEIVITTLSEAVQRYQELQPKGEYVLILSGADPKNVEQKKVVFWKEWGIEKHLAYYEAEGLVQKEAMKKVAKDRNVSKRDIYKHIHGKKHEE